MEGGVALDRMTCDVLVIGGGAAGMRAAWEAKKACPEADVLLIGTGALAAGGSTNLVASEALGINAPFNFEGDGDTPDIYYEDTVQTGGGLGSPALCRIIADEAADRVRELMDLGIQFESRDGHPEQKKLSGCTKARSLTMGGSTGREIVRVLTQAALKAGVRLMDRMTVTRLLRDSRGVVCGAAGVSGGKAFLISAGAVVLASGGAGSMFQTNVTPPTQTGDGWAMAYDAGCRFVNMEFFQVGPAVAIPRMKFIIHSHMWRLKPKLTNGLHQEFLPSYCPPEMPPLEALDLKAMSYPFSVRTGAMYVDIAIFKEIMAGRGNEFGGIWFDVTHVSGEELLRRAPITYKTLLKAGIDLAKAPMPLTLAVQNFNGGIEIDENGFTGVDGLYAAGEITGGVHGSDRPGGNNLTDTQVFGRRAGIAAARRALKHKGAAPEETDNGLMPTDREKALIVRSEELFYKHLTIVRREEGLRETLAFIGEAQREAVCDQLKNRLTVGRLLATAQLMRTESRGTHYREDFPKADPCFLKRIRLSKKADGTMAAAFAAGAEDI